MKNSKKMFVILEMVLAVLVLVLAIVMIREQGRGNCHKVSVILSDSDSGRWSAFRYGLKMAAEDQGLEMFVVSTGEMLTVEEEIRLIQEEINNGADAVIVQPVTGAETERKLKETAKKIPVMLAGNTASEDKETSLLPVTETDHYAMGRALAEEVLKDYNGNVAGKTLGIVTQNEVSADAVSRNNGFQDGIKGKGARISWSVSDSLENQSKTDLVIALDDASLTMAGECSASNNLHGALVYGIGNSTDAVYYLDTGIAACLVVPDEFNAGYQSMTEVAENLKHHFHKMKSQTLSFTVMRREELFSPKNQEILFTMSQ